MTRLTDLAARLEQPLLITNLTNVFYLTGFDTSNAALLVRPGGEATLYTDFRYIEAARGVDGVDAVLTKRTLLTDVGERLDGTVQFEADVLPYGEWQRLKSGGTKLVATAGIVDELRAVKDEQELKAIRRAARAADRAFEALTAEPFIGHSEREIAWRLRELMHAHGVDEVSFETAVGYGPHGAHPHWTPTDTIISPGTFVVVDWGARVDGYCSDCTRTVSTGRLPDKLREIYDLCLDAQKKACAGIKAGLTGVEADALARDVITEGRYGDAFGHGLGHGVGLLIHEAPRLSTESTDTLASGHVVTIEPGIYLEGVAGVRIEDLAIVGEDGVELLTAFPKELIEVR
jgi:Xaa-Pro aminopeptidase